MTPSDMVVLFLFAGTTLAAVLDHDVGMLAAFSAIGAIGLTYIIASRAKSHSALFKCTADGTPIVVFEHSDCDCRRMRRLRLTEPHLIAATRQRALMHPRQGRHAVAERDVGIPTVQDQAA